MDTLTLRAQSIADANIFLNFVTKQSILVRQEDELTILLSGPAQKLALIKEKSPVSLIEVPSKPIKTYQKYLPKTTIIEPHTTLLPRTGRSWFYATEVASIYQFPSPAVGAKAVIGVVSFGGGLVGSVDGNGVLTNGDCQAYWTLCGISPSNFPTVVVKPILGATNDLSDSGSTGENTLDVETIGACCPTSDTIIILYIVPNTLDNFTNVINYMLSTPVTVNSVAVKPTVISISWGLPEIYLSATQLSTTNTAFGNAVAQGVSICTATGDNGANDGVGGTGKYTDFPSSSPNVIACGGTRLVCPNYTYDNATAEYAWSSGGGGVSQKYLKPLYQTSLPGTYRQTPDVASVADPNTGVLFIVYGQYVVYGGTSVSAPTIAGFLASINCRAWANPSLYSFGLSNYNDILTGNNGGYTCATGYDNCTGLGSPKGNFLRNLFAARVSSITLNTYSTQLGTGKTFQAIATINPSNALNKTVTWSSSFPSIATVGSSGVITGVSKGTASITVTSQDGNKQATIKVTVVQSVTGITVSPTTLTIRKGRSSRPLTTVLPSTAANKTVMYSSGNTSIATVSSNGTITGVNTGIITITATTVDGSYTGRCNVTVTN